mmetsp:Transcript_60725/g.159677  ORF Transcript_60725/g.159677 Transcript_60725/m.159677 type:complete len:226 (-) Transcript_60725:91-768(-)
MTALRVLALSLLATGVAASNSSTNTTTTTTTTTLTTVYPFTMADFNYFSAGGGCDLPTFEDVTSANGSLVLGAYVMCLHCNCQNYDPALIANGVGADLAGMVGSVLNCGALVTSTSTCASTLGDVPLVQQSQQMLVDGGLSWTMGVTFASLCALDAGCCPSSAFMSGMGCPVTYTTTSTVTMTTTTTTTTMTVFDGNGAATATVAKTAILSAVIGAAAASQLGLF